MQLPSERNMEIVAQAVSRANTSIIINNQQTIQPIGFQAPSELISSQPE